MTKTELNQATIANYHNLKLRGAFASCAMWRTKVLKGKCRDFVDGFKAGERIRTIELNRIYDAIYSQ